MRAQSLPATAQVSRNGTRGGAIASHRGDSAPCMTMSSPTTNVVEKNSATSSTPATHRVTMRRSSESPLVLRPMTEPAMAATKTKRVTAIGIVVRAFASPTMPSRGIPVSETAPTVSSARSRANGPSAVARPATRAITARNHNCPIRTRTSCVSNASRPSRAAMNTAGARRMGSGTVAMPMSVTSRYANGVSGSKATRAPAAYTE